MPNTSTAQLDYAPIGNGRVAALVDRRGRIVWFCLPRVDGDPIFSRLLAGHEEKGFCDILPTREMRTVSRYVRNTAILETIFDDDAGNAVRIVDFTPRLKRFERIHHPPTLFRRIEPLSGMPRLAIRVRPTLDYGRLPQSMSVGSNHIRYIGGAGAVRVTTDASPAYIAHETPFALTRPVTLVIGPDEPFEGAIDPTARDLLERTQKYWLDWVRSLGVPFEWQEAVIRAAITLKLCSVDETGAIVAALTTSIPEAPGSQRTWDYRYCWPRDAHFVIKALNQLGATQTMEAYLDYITSLSADAGDSLQPVYGIIHDQPLQEIVTADLAGFRGHDPVRIGNAAAEQPQHDTYGSIILGASQMFIDDRLPTKGGVALFEQLEQLGERARRFVAEPDAGPWEYRGRRRIHTYSAAMCWVACDRLGRIAAKLSLAPRARYWKGEADRLRAEILERAWHPARRAFVAAFDSDDLDAAVLLLADLGLLAADDPRFASTVDAVGADLVRGGYVMRYTAPDDFGAPDMAFLACQFWYIDALERLGRREPARALFVDILARRNHFGILSEDIDPASGMLWGNMPQTYCMAGIINSAAGLSRPWKDAWTPFGTI